MTLETGIHLAQTVIMGAAAAGVGLLKWGYRGGTAYADYQSVKARLDAFETAQKSEATAQREWRTSIGGKVSDLTSEIQGMPERLRGIFLPREEARLIVQRLENGFHREPGSKTRHGDR